MVRFVGGLVLLLALVATVRGPFAGAGGAVGPRVAAASRDAEPTAGNENDVAARDRWFYHQRAYPNRYTPPGALARSIRQANALDRPAVAAPTTAPATKLAWARIGPQPIATIGPAASAVAGDPAGPPPFSGRVTAVAPDPTNADVVYIGGAAGGVWKSTDGGVTWSPKFDYQPSLAVGAIAVDPANPQTVWVGTGESNFSHDSYYGQGIYKSTNGGTSWTKVGGTTFDSCSIVDLAIVNSSTIVADLFSTGSLPGPGCHAKGIWRTTDGGANWANITVPGSQNQDVLDLAQPTSPKATIYAGAIEGYYGAGTPVSGVWRSTNGGATWTRLTGLAVSDGYRPVLAVAPSNGSVLYVAYAIEATYTSTSLLRGVWKSSNVTAASPTFTQVVAGGASSNPGPCTYPGDPGYGQCQYDFALAVSRTDPATFYLGGIRLFKYTNSGATGAAIGYGAATGNIHVDQHALVYDKSGRLWVGNDGGVYRTDNGGSSFLNRNGSGGGALALTEFTGWTSGSLATAFIGGTQDNGTVKFTPASGPNWQQTHGGDGGASAFQSPSVFYATYSGLDVEKTTNGGTSYVDVSGPWSADAEYSSLYPPLEMSPASSQVLFRGTDTIWKTTNGGSSWSTVASHTGTAVSAIGVAKSNPGYLYGAWDTTPLCYCPPRVRYTHDGSTWHDVPAGQLPERYFTDFSVSPANANLAYVTVSGFNPGGNPAAPFGGHVYKTTNGGSAWTNVSGDLPDSPVNAIAVDYSKTPNVIYVGTDIGVFWSADGGVSWGRGGTGTAGLPYSPVLDVRLDGATLVAATHGRSAFKVPAPSAIAISGFSPSSGITGSNVTISGTNLLYAKSVLFGTKASPSVSYSLGKVTAKVPDGATPGKITVKTAEGIAATSVGTYTPTLSIKSFSPASGAVGSSVTISGLGLSGISAVRFDGTAATTFSAGTGTSATAVVPAGATSGKISVTTAAGTVQSPTSFTVT